MSFVEDSTMMMLTSSRILPRSTATIFSEFRMVDKRCAIVKHVRPDRALFNVD
jgi:hypothetical protein